MSTPTTQTTTLKRKRNNNNNAYNNNNIIITTSTVSNIQHSQSTDAIGLDNTNDNLTYQIPAGYTYDIFLEQINQLNILCNKLNGILLKRKTTNIANNNDKNNNNDNNTQYDTQMYVLNNADQIDYIPCNLYNTIDDIINKFNIQYLVNNNNNNNNKNNNNNYNIGLYNKQYNIVYTISNIIKTITIQQFIDKLNLYNISLKQCLLVQYITIQIHLYDSTIQQDIMLNDDNSNSVLCYVHESIDNVIKQIKTQLICSIYNNDTIECNYYYCIYKNNKNRQKQLLDNNKSISDYNFNNSNNAIVLCNITKHIINTDTNNICLTIQLHNNISIYIICNIQTTTVQQLKYMIQQYINIVELTQSYYLVYNNEIMYDTLYLYEYNITQTKSTIQLIQLVDNNNNNDMYIVRNKQYKNNWFKCSYNVIQYIIELTSYIQNMPMYSIYDTYDNNTIKNIILQYKTLIYNLYINVYYGLIIGHNLNGYTWINNEQHSSIIPQYTEINLISPQKENKKIYVNKQFSTKFSKLVDNTTKQVLSHRTVQKSRKLHKFSFTNSDNHGPIKHNSNRGGNDNDINNNNNTLQVPSNNNINNSIDVVNLISPH